MPRKSVKKMIKELMAKKKLTSKEKKLLMRMQKGGVWWNPSTWFSSTTTPVDEAALTKQFEDLKSQICKVCKAAYGEEGCKCGNTAPVPPMAEPTSATENSPATELPENQQPSGDGDLKSEESMPPAGESTTQPQPGKQIIGGKRRSSKRKNKRSRRMSKKTNC